MLAPKGVASWMAMVQQSHSEVQDMLKDLIVDTDAFGWSRVPLMLVESDGEG